MSLTRLKRRVLLWNSLYKLTTYRRKRSYMAKRKSTQAKGPALKVIPLGGLDGIGKNMTVI